MPTYAEKTKEQKIKAQITKLRGVFKSLDENKKKTVEALIQNAAFMTVCLEELQAEINEKGYTDEYKNGANQYGTKQSEAVKTHIAMTRNHAAILKTLADLAPPKPKPQSKLGAMKKDIQ
jgi:O6-methylguanine-DNA--protein-cysteine methyltransferase